MSIDLLSSVAKSKVPQQEPLTAKISSYTFLHNSHRFLKISIRRKDSVICPSITVIYLSLDNETAQKWVEKASVRVIHDIKAVNTCSQAAQLAKSPACVCVCIVSMYMHYGVFDTAESFSPFPRDGAYLVLSRNLFV